MSDGAGRGFPVNARITLHSVQEIEIQFARDSIRSHSVVYPLWQLLLYAPLVGDAHTLTLHLDGVLGATAGLGAYLFAASAPIGLYRVDTVRQR
ncbi:MAG: hypothetical protein ACRERC_11820 [Candidatus Binatia bacterium]